MNYPEPPAWGLAIGFAGRLLVYLGAAAFVLSIAGWLFAPRSIRFETAGKRMFAFGAIAIALAMLCHFCLLVLRQYEFEYVWRNTRNEMPGIYRISAAWAAQEGSFLLWTVTSACLAALCARRTGTYRRWYSVLAGLFLAGMAGILCYESPFRLLTIEPDLLAELPAGQSLVMPPDGLGLNPVLQNYWMAIHPWVIFAGFGSLLVLFAWGGSAVFSKDLKSWITPARPLAILSTTLLGVGLIMGGLWAYETLGWGGFWAWDPVENVSLVPLIAMAALIHGLYLQSNRGSWERLNPFLAALPFAWSIYGTFLARSGQLANVSVHSFAQMNPSAHKLLLTLVGIVILVLVAMLLYVRRSPGESADAKLGQRGIAMNAGIAALYGIGMLAAVGMSVPFLSAVFDGGRKAVITEEVFNKITVWPLIPVLLLMAAAPFLGWTATTSARWQRLGLCGATALALTVAAIWFLGSAATINWGISALIWLTAFAVVANFVRFLERRRSGLAQVGGFVMHTGVALTLMGLIASRGFEQSAFGPLTMGEPARFDMAGGQYIATLQASPTPAELVAPEHRLEIRLADVESQGDGHLLRPTLFFIPSMGEGAPLQTIARPSIYRALGYDLYLSVNGRETAYERDIGVTQGEPTRVMIGDDPVIITYLGSQVTGDGESAGSKISLRFRVEYKGEIATAISRLEYTGDEVRHLDSLVGDVFGIRVESVDTATSATISLLTPEPVFLVELFYKPLTSLVWLGALLFTIGGVLAMFGRRG
jgi:cytochrome c-type biogenesis protein CcmF